MGVAQVGFGPTADLVPQLSGQPVRDLFRASAARFPTATYADKPN